MSDAMLVMVSCADQEEARRIARALVEQRLAACVHVQPHDSIYWWEGAIETAEEVSLLIKTVPDLFEPVCASIRAMHSYTLPAILAVPAVAEPATMAWLASETAGARHLRPALDVS
jgi:periplasmic divalent cation tolerance protein